MGLGYLDTKIGTLLIKEENEKIVLIELVDIKESKEEETKLIIEAKSQLSKYFNGSLKEFNLNYELKGTNYQKKIWNELTKIPYGSTISYQELARRVGNIKGSRSAGAACGKNNILIVVPCHRVIGKNGKLTGFTGGLTIKEQLLNLENIL